MVQCHSKKMCDSAHSGDYVNILDMIQNNAEVGQVDWNRAPDRWKRLAESVLRLSRPDASPDILHG